MGRNIRRAESLIGYLVAFFSSSHHKPEIKKNWECAFDNFFGFKQKLVSSKEYQNRTSVLYFFWTTWKPQEMKHILVTPYNGAIPPPWRLLAYPSSSAQVWYSSFLHLPPRDLLSELICLAKSPKLSTQIQIWVFHFTRICCCWTVNLMSWKWRIEADRLDPQQWLFEQVSSEPTSDGWCW